MHILRCLRIIQPHALFVRTTLQVLTTLLQSSAEAIELTMHTKDKVVNSSEYVQTAASALSDHLSHTLHRLFASRPL